VKMEHSISKTNSICTFWLDNHLFGVDVMKVQEVIPVNEITQVPFSKSEIAGITNLRGQIVTAIDLRRRLWKKHNMKKTSPINFFVRVKGELVSFLVDSIGDVIEVQEEDFERHVDTKNEISEDLIHGVYKLPRSLLLILDVDRAADVITTSDYVKRRSDYLKDNDRAQSAKMPRLHKKDMEVVQM